jgi:hypothetical protein
MGDADDMSARLMRIEASLVSLHCKVDRIVQHEMWLSRLRRRLDQYRIVRDGEDDEDDVLGAIGRLVYIHCTARLNQQAALC